MTCDFCGSFLHLWKDCRDRKEHRESRNSKTCANVEEFDEDEQEEDDAHAYHDNEVTPESEAFITDHLADLGLIRLPNLPRSRARRSVLQILHGCQHHLILYTSQTYNNTIGENKYDKKKKMLLLDTGCVRTVCGKRWLEHSIATMDSDSVRPIPGIGIGIIPILIPVSVL